jgi:hypothetical protein
MAEEHPIELEPAGGSVETGDADPRPRMPEPLPVRLIAVANVRLQATAGLELQLDAFYVGVLGFERDGAPRATPRLTEPLLGGDRVGTTAPPLALGLRNDEEPPAAIDRVPRSSDDIGRGKFMPGPVYLAENFRLLFEVVEGRIIRDDLRAVRIEVPSLGEAEAKLLEAKMEYTRQRGLQPGEESIVLLDPGGNWAEITEMTRVG